MCTRCHEEKDLDRLRTQVRGTFRHQLLNSSGNSHQKYIERSNNIVLQLHHLSISLYIMSHLVQLPPHEPNNSPASFHQFEQAQSHTRTIKIVLHR
jgi:hypothetical protein